jgi:hypothetical protein
MNGLTKAASFAYSVSGEPDSGLLIREEGEITIVVSVIILSG